MENIFTKNEQKVMRIFVDYPTGLFTAREVARLAGMTHPTASKALLRLNKVGFLARQLEKNISGIGGHLLWKANRIGERYKLYKKALNLERIYSSGLVEKIAGETSPNAIVLFGSYGRGEDTEESDIDIFVVSKEKAIDVAKYGRQLHRKINLTFESEPARLTKEFLNNLVNGMVLYGYFEAIK